MPSGEIVMVKGASMLEIMPTHRHYAAFDQPGIPLWTEADYVAHTQPAWDAVTRAEAA